MCSSHLFGLVRDSLVWFGLDGHEAVLGRGKDFFFSSDGESAQNKNAPALQNALSEVEGLHRRTTYMRQIRSLIMI